MKIKIAFLCLFLLCLTLSGCTGGDSLEESTLPVPDPEPVPPQIETLGEGEIVDMSPAPDILPQQAPISTTAPAATDSTIPSAAPNPVPSTQPSVRPDPAPSETLPATQPTQAPALPPITQEPTWRLDENETEIDFS